MYTGDTGDTGDMVDTIIKLYIELTINSDCGIFKIN